MSDTKISALPAATTPLTGAELLPLVQAGASVRAPVSAINFGLTAPTYAAARLLSGITTGDRLQVLGRTSQSDGGQGLFTWVAGGSTTINDGIELAATSGIWRRSPPLLITAGMYGLASFTFATLPATSPASYLGYQAYTTDQGFVFSNGTTWLPLAGGLGASIAFAPSTGTIDPTITGFVAGVGSIGTGRLNITLAGDTSFKGLPAGVDGQQLQILVVAGAFTLTLLVDNETTVQKEILGSNNLAAALGDALSLYYDASLDAGNGMWVLTP